MVANDDNPEVARRRRRLKDVLSEAGSPPAPPPPPAPSAAAPAPKPRRRKPSTLSVVGSGNVVGDGNTVNNHFHEQPKVIRKTVVKTGDGVLNASQKAEILRITQEIAETEAAVKKSPRSIAAIRGALKRRFDVNKYDEIKSEDYDAVIKYLNGQRGRLQSAKSAPKKDPKWRSKRITAIQTRCGKFPDGQTRRMAYMATHFGASSLLELDDAQLDQVYRHVFGWR